MSERHKILAVIFTVAVGILLAATLPVDGPAGLPEEFLGRWFFAGSSGGISGEGAGGEAGASIVITEENRIDRYAADATLVTTESFMPSRGKSIYGPEEVWLLDASSEVPRVITLDPDGVLSISDNVYDGFSTTYRRTP